MPTTVKLPPDPTTDLKSLRAELVLNAPLKGLVGARSGARLLEVLGQFQVTSNPRYKPRGGDTFCTCLAQDATYNLGCPIPHWRLWTQDQLLPYGFTPEVVAKTWSWPWYELNGNRTALWLDSAEARAQLWSEVALPVAVQLAACGWPVAAAVFNPHGVGHIAMGLPTSTGLDFRIAQAGGFNLWNEPILAGFGKELLALTKYYAHP